jgi:hypothetical protein
MVTNFMRNHTGLLELAGFAAEIASVEALAGSQGKR